MRFILPLFALATTGCGSADPAGACEEYVSAYNACINEFGGLKPSMPRSVSSTTVYRAPKPKMQKPPWIVAPAGLNSSTVP